MVTVSAELAEIREWWVRRSGTTSRPPLFPEPMPPDPTLRRPTLPEPVFRLAGSSADQLLAAGVDNPYWTIVRQLPWVSGAQGRCPDGFARGLPVGHHLLTKRYSWAIPSPGDMVWLAVVLGGRGLVEIGAGSGYWSWQARQAGIDVIAYEPADPATNTFTDGTEYLALRRADHRAARAHPDRALLLCWPSHDDPWAAHALRAYTGDLLVYIGEGRGGRCADQDFFRLLDREWTLIGTSRHHITWRFAHSTMTAYRRRLEVAT